MAGFDKNYYIRRANEERRRAASSEMAVVAERHATLAGLYELRANDPAAWAAISTQKSGSHC